MTGRWATGDWTLSGELVGPVRYFDTLEEALAYADIEGIGVWDTTDGQDV